MIRKLLICSAYRVCSHMLQVHKLRETQTLSPTHTHGQPAKLPLEAQKNTRGLQKKKKKKFKPLLETESLPKQTDTGAR